MAGQLSVEQQDNRQNVPVVWVMRRIIVSERLDNICERVVLPADQDVASSAVALHEVFYAIRVVAVAGDINFKAEILGERFDRVVRSLSLSA